MTRFVLLLLLPALLTQLTTAQPVAPASVATAHSPAGPPFRLTEAERAYVDQVLAMWEAESAKIKTFRCDFKKWVYNHASPHPRVHSVEERGEVSYQRPDKGKYHVTGMKVWKAEPVAPGQAAPPGQTPAGRHVEVDMAEEGVVGDHWVSDGKHIYQYRPHEKKLVVTPIPPEMQGERIVDGPLPFLFAAKAGELQRRFWMRPQAYPADPNVIWLIAIPRTLKDSGSYSRVDLHLDRGTLLPMAMQVYAPNGGQREVYKFEPETVSINHRVSRLWQALFESPRTPRGWRRVVEDRGVRQATTPPAGRR